MSLKSNPAVWKPSTSEVRKQLAGSCEISALSLKSGGPVAVSFYDGVDQTAETPANLKWVLEVSSVGNDNQNFSLPIIFKKGMWAVVEQGVDQNPIVCFAAANYVA